MTRKLIRAINWNKIEDPIDLQMWNTLTGMFWLPERIALSNDLVTWNAMTPEERDVTAKVFSGLTLLDTVQNNVGAISLMPDARTPHEEAVLTQIAFTEAIHAKSYSYIFSTLLSSEEIEDTFRWTEVDPYLLTKEEIILKHYDGDDPLKRKIASVFLESFLFYSGFYWPLFLASKARLPNTADVIRLIIQEEALHGYYIGYKFQQAFNELDPESQEGYRTFAYELLYDLYDNEVQYTQSLYDQVGRTEDVKKFLHYNANKALMNLGLDPLFSASQTDASPAVLSALSPVSDENHDFFSGSGSSYMIGKVEDLDDEDWEF